MVERVIFLDTFIRFMGVSLLLLLAILTLRYAKHSASARYLVLACISSAALLMGFTPIFLPPPEYLFYAVRLMDVPHFIFIWLFALSLFDGRFKPGLFHATIGIAYCAPIFLLRLLQFGVIDTLPNWVVTGVNLGTIPIVAHLLWFTLKGRMDDLNEGRRAARFYFVGLIVFVAVTSTLSELLLTGEQRAILPTAKALIFLPGILFACFWLLRIEPIALSFGVSAPRIPEKLNDRELVLSRHLEKEMVERKAYLNPQLTIATLAARIDAPPYRLRALINTSLGHQNFSVYINRFWIEAIKDAIADPANVDKPILAIALDHGFNSLSPFNRAFREFEGITPTEYKRQLQLRK